MRFGRSGRFLLRSCLKSSRIDVHASFIVPADLMRIYRVAEPELKKLTVCCERNGIPLAPQMDVAAEVSNQLKPLLDDKDLQRKFPGLIATLREVAEGYYVDMTINGHEAYRLLTGLTELNHNQYFKDELSGDIRYSTERIASYSPEKLREDFMVMQRARAEGWQ